VLERLNSLGTLDIRAEGFKYLLSRGRIVLILDGFDEMLELAPAHARENLHEIRRHLEGISKLVLTSRKTLFPNLSAIASFLGLSDAEPGGLALSVCSLKGFTENQLRIFHKARGATDSEIQTIMKLPLDKELQQAPQIAEYFVDVVRAQIELGEKNVFEPILSLIYRRESTKWEKEGNPAMPPQLQEDFLREISLVMWPGGSTAPELVQMLADDMGHRYLSKHHLLQLTLDGQLQFEHHVWRDWFMARALLKRIEESSWKPSVLSNMFGDPLPEYCVGFLADKLEQAQTQNALKDPAFSDATFSNLLRIAIRQIPTDSSKAQRAKALQDYLGSAALSFRSLEMVSFELFDFRDWRFENVVFDQVRFSFCTLPRNNERQFTNARGVQFSECDWWPHQVIDDAAFTHAKASLKDVLRRFVWCTEPLRTRDEVSKEHMTRRCRVADDDKALRCLIKAGHIEVVLRAGSEEVYRLNKQKLADVVRFIKQEKGLDEVIGCIVR